MSSTFVAIMNSALGVNIPDVRSQRPSLPSLRDIFPKELLDAPFERMPHDHLQAPRRIGLPKLDVETSLLAPIAPSFVNFHRHTESTAPYTAPSSASSARLLALTEQAQSLTHATLGVFGGAAPGSLDIFWPDPQTLKAKHVASSTSPWSNTQALTGPGAESALVDDLAEPQSRGQGAVATLPNTLTAKERKFEACARFSTVQSSRRPSSTLNARANRAAQAQAEFEREVARGTAARRHAAKLAPAILTFVLESGVSPTDVNARVRASTSGINWREPCGTIRHYTCPLCGRSFDRPSGLHVHGRKHTGHRPFTCPFPGCESSFSVNSNMRRHLLLHFPAGLGGEE